MPSELIMALEHIEKEKNISKAVLLEALEVALSAAYKKNFGVSGDVNVLVDDVNGNIKVYVKKEVVDEVEDPESQIYIDSAKQINPIYGIGDIVEIEANPERFGRIAAQTAKQIVIQKIREAEHSNKYNELIEYQNEIVVATVQKQERRGLLLDINGTEAMLPNTEMIAGESYKQNDKIRVLVSEVRNTPRGVVLNVTRVHQTLIRKLFERDVPEIADGIVKIINIVREPGFRTKIAVYSENSELDPVGACIGQRGTRIQAILNELKEEKIDIVRYYDDPEKYISQALNPAKTLNVTVEPGTKQASVLVSKPQLSLAIGKDGQNVRLAARLTGYRIDIKCEEDYGE